MQEIVASQSFQSFDNQPRRRRINQYDSQAARMLPFYPGGNLPCCVHFKHGYRSRWPPGCCRV